MLRETDDLHRGLLPPSIDTPTHHHAATPPPTHPPTHQEVLDHEGWDDEPDVVRSTAHILTKGHPRNETLTDVVKGRSTAVAGIDSFGCVLLVRVWREVGGED